MVEERKYNEGQIENIVRRTVDYVIGEPIDHFSSDVKPGLNYIDMTLLREELGSRFGISVNYSAFEEYRNKDNRRYEITPEQISDYIKSRVKISD